MQKEKEQHYCGKIKNEIILIDKKMASEMFAVLPIARVATPISSEFPA